MGVFVMRSGVLDLVQYQEKGFCIAKGAVEKEQIERLLNRFLDLVEEESGRRFASAHGSDIAQFLTENRAMQTRVYDRMREGSWIEEFSLRPSVIEAVRDVLGQEIVMMGHAPFRIDAPMETSELAVWHQDYFYVGGNEDIVTVWIPMQDVSFSNGAIGVMPASHRLGPLEHSVNLLKKRHTPAGIFDREIRLVEMAGGDLLIFHSCLLHTSNMNLSNSIRFSLQPRYSRASDDTDPRMGRRIAIN